MKKIYSPKQMYLATFLGGPVTGVYFLMKNFSAMEEYEKTRITFLWGSFFVLALAFIVSFLPDSFPNYVIPAAYTGALSAVVSKYQMKKTDIQESDAYTFHSGWNVMFVAVMGLAVFLILFLTIFIGLDAAGYVDIDAM